MSISGRVIVIGLGQFGSSVALNLSELGVDVIAIDTSDERVAMVADQVGRSMTANGSELAVLEDLRVDTTAAVLNAIGDEFLLDSILCTAHLRQLGAPRLIARATNATHARVLKAIGAHEIIAPEREIGKVVARRIARTGIINQFNLGENMSVVEFEIPEKWIEKSLIQLDLRRSSGIQVAAIRPISSGEWSPATPEHSFERADRVLAFGQSASIDQIMREA
jgi:trk system potassium uptake protein TrkA